MNQWTWTGPVDSTDDITPIDHYLDAHLASDQANRCRRLAHSTNDRETGKFSTTWPTNMNAGGRRTAERTHLSSLRSV